LKDERVYIWHILDEIEYLLSLRDSLTLEELTTRKGTEHAVTRALEIIGEATKNIPEQFKKQHPDIPWREMAGMRDRIIHGYFTIDYEVIWHVIQEDIPLLEPQIRDICDAMKTGT
jgi:uncharacterized protein with HEPN domain